MRALAFWKAVTADKANLLERFVGLLTRNGVSFCLIGGQAVNAYADPLVSLDLDVVVAAADLPRVEALMASEFTVRRFEHSLNVSSPGSNLRVQIQTDPRYASFPERATIRDVLDLALPVASVEDVLQGKVWAAQDPTRRASKRQKDHLDIARLLEAYPHLRSRVPAEIISRLL